MQKSSINLCFCMLPKSFWQWTNSMLIFIFLVPTFFVSSSFDCSLCSNCYIMYGMLNFYWSAISFFKHKLLSTSDPSLFFGYILQVTEKWHWVLCTIIIIIIRSTLSNILHFKVVHISVWSFISIFFWPQIVVQFRSNVLYTWRVSHFLFKSFFSTHWKFTLRTI